VIEFPLELRIREDGLEAVDGWFLPGADVDVWVEWVIEAFCERAGDAVIVPIPRSSSDATPVGVFVVGAVISDRACRTRAIPYSLVGGRLFIPADSELRIPLLSAEFAAAFLNDINVLHPTIGLVSADTEEALGLVDLLEVPECHPGHWNAARMAPPVGPAQLSFIALEPPIEAGEFLSKGREDIASNSTQELKGEPGERGPGLLPRAKEFIGDAFFGGISKLMGMIPQTGSSHNMFNRLEDWANARWSQLTLRQQQEIDRLLKLLSSDPDKGLRHAIPLGGDGSHRGEEQADLSLGSQKVDFDLARLGGGGSVQYWMLSWEHQQALSDLYRSAANRELTLRRFRRAAFIFAHLLNDYQSAASALKSGGYFREAAVLYRKHLTADRTAADCLREGGLYEDAAALYEELREYELLGDMYRDLERDGDASEAFERSVAEARRRNDTIQASRIVDRKLKQPDRARGMLSDAWPQGMNADVCVEEYFRLLQRDEIHDEARSAIATLSGKTEAPSQRLTLARVLAGIRNSYPQEEVAADSEDATRVLIGGYLAQHGRDVKSAAEIVKTLDSGDPLLGRDARAFTKNEQTRAKDPSSPPVSATEAQVQLTWVSAAPAPKGFRILRAVISPGKRLVFIGLTEGMYPAIWVEGAEIMKIWDPVRLPAWEIYDASFVRFGSDGLQILMISTNRGLPDQGDVRLDSDEFQVCINRFAAVVEDPNGYMFDYVDGDRLSRYSKGQLDWTRQISESLGRDQEPPTLKFAPLCATGKSVFLGSGNELVRICGDDEQRVETPAAALSLIQSSPHPDKRLMFNMDFGAGLFRDDAERWNRIRYFASDMEAPQVAFTRTGHIIAANAEKVRVYVVGRYEISKVAQVEGPGESVCSIVEGEHAASFRLVTERRVITYRIDEKS
jgi:tetratricopeptide (TPR) repeat protein